MFEYDSKETFGFGLKKLPYYSINYQFKSNLV